MFLGRDSDAQTAFLRYRGQKIGDQLWEQAIHTGFDEQRKAGRSRQLMDTIEKILLRGQERPSPPLPIIFWETATAISCGPLLDPPTSMQANSLRAKGCWMMRWQ